MQWYNQTTGINLSLVLITNIFGLLLMIILLVSKGWTARNKYNETKIIPIVLVSIIVGCIVEPLTYIVDGVPGGFIHYIAIVLNTILFSLNIIIGPGYVTIITRHINERLMPVQTMVIKGICLVEFGMLVVNLFWPILFVIDENNIYVRKNLFWVFVVIEAALMFYGLFIYLIAKVQGRVLRFFPAWLFFIPMVTGMTIQGLIYGASTVWPCAGIAFCGIIICIQNENIYLDKLTGVYNRYYLDEVKRTFKRRRRDSIGAMMLDMNGFKAINDDFSHEEGDKVLVEVANILCDCVEGNGSVIRFAGDEFVVLVNTSSADELVRYRSDILQAFEDYNETSGKPYKLSAAIGFDIFDFKNEGVSDFLNDIDNLMYKNKEEYYRTHDRRSRRSSDRRGENKDTET
ncbi:MAG: GGDEF domain-containing protein [Lachnospiraceae bacterium]|nr:GGDEF domain-containing protein [Lachnospiraceae bacterium]